MTCPDWSLLTAHRRADAGSPAAEVPPEWPEALEHLDGCPDCRRDAPTADPLLIFRRLPAVEAGSAEIDDVRAGVAALRRARRVTHRAEGREAPGRKPARWWWRGAAAAVLAFGLLGLQPGMDPSVRSEVPAWETGTAVPIAALLSEANAAAVDDIEHPTASVYHFDDEQVGVVMVVDAGLDV